MSTTYLKLFVDCLEKYQKLNDTEFGRLVRAALRYKATGAEPDDLGREALLWDGMRLDIDRDNESYQTVVEARASAGKKGAAVRWQRQKQDGKNSKCHFANGKNGQEEDKDKEEDKDITPPTPSWQNSKGKSGPTFEQVMAYAEMRRTGIDPKPFFDYYSSAGWKDSEGKPVLNWQQKFIAWEMREFGKDKKEKQKEFRYDYGDKRGSL